MTSTTQRPTFRTEWGEGNFKRKYAHEGAETWEKLSALVVDDVTTDMLSRKEKAKLIEFVTDMKAIPGGRYLYYAGRDPRFYNNCFLLKAEEDTREEWGNLAKRATDCLMTGGGIGIDYSILRESGADLKRTGGKASGPIALMEMINEIGRRVMQGGSRRSAIYASLNWQHPDAYDPERTDTFIAMKNWDEQQVPGAFNEDGTPFTYGDAKKQDFNAYAPMDMSNVSLNYDNAFLAEVYGMNEEDFHTMTVEEIEDLDIVSIPATFLENVRQAMKTGEPGFSFNFHIDGDDREDETLRNACTEVVSRDDSDVCNLLSINMGNVETIEEFEAVVVLATKFLVCGTLRAHLPYQKINDVRQKNRRLGLGLMGIHEWLLKRGERYEVTPELHKWLAVYERASTKTAYDFCDSLGISRPAGIRAIAPTGTIATLPGTTQGIEPLFAVAYLRRWLENGTEWKEQVFIDGTAQVLIDEYNLKPNDIETSYTLALDPERRLKFQYEIQKYVDQSISSTVNMPSWGSPINNEDTVEDMARTLAKYAHGLRGKTFYPDGGRGGQPYTPVEYFEARRKMGLDISIENVDICDLTGAGSCG